jgi:hypothetical protein
MAILPIPGGVCNLTGNGGALTFDNTPGHAALIELAVGQGDTLSAPVYLNTDLNVSNASANAPTTSSGIFGTNNLNFLGSSLLALSRAIIFLAAPWLMPAARSRRAATR